MESATGSTREPREVRVGREDRHAMAPGDGAQREVCIRTLNAARVSG